VPSVMVVHPSVPAATVPEFIAYAKANPGKINMASVGSGSPPHVTGELFKMMAGVDMVHVPYRGGGWAGIGAPKITPAEVVEKLNKEINGALADEKIKARLADLGSVPMPMSPADFGKFIAEDTEKWGKVIRAANINPE
jgi:tripartite-type tricarboxylate transporter receptor subunit TctC